MDDHINTITGNEWWCLLQGAHECLRVVKVGINVFFISVYEFDSLCVSNQFCFHLRNTNLYMLPCDNEMSLNESDTIEE